MTSFRNCVFTWNNYSEEDEEYVQGLECKYLVYGREKGEEGTPHLQGYIELAKRTRFNALRKMFKNNHIEKRRGTAQQAADYCKKDEDFFEKGTISNPGKRNDLNAFVETIKANPLKRKLEIMEEFPSVYARYPRFCNEYRMLCVKAEALTWTETPNLWVWGPPGTGKSRRFQELESVFSKPPNKWWDGYDGEHTVLIEDVEPMHFRLGWYFKIWADRYPFNAEFKGFSHKIRPQRIAITSNFKPEDVFDGQVLAAIKRRFQVIEVKQQSEVAD